MTDRAGEGGTQRANRTKIRSKKPERKCVLRHSSSKSLRISVACWALSVSTIVSRPRWSSSGGDRTSNEERPHSGNNCVTPAGRQKDWNNNWPKWEIQYDTQPRRLSV